ncbi:MAG: class I SAM-dependent methyltransferase [Chloroflexi bacterium]|nr:class I SAM-dependent methyltransferase [Chloroflexota bacterium]
MPFVAGLFDTLVQIRTLHHAADVGALFTQLARIARPGGEYVLEFANKQNLKAILRYGLKRQDWSPFALEPVEFVALNYDFHPAWIRQQLQEAGFYPGQMLTVSHFRLGAVKDRLPTGF